MTQYVPMLKGELKDRIIVMEDPPNAMNETYSEVLGDTSMLKLTTDAILDSSRCCDWLAGAVT